MATLNFSNISCFTKYGTESYLSVYRSFICFPKVVLKEQLTGVFLLCYFCLFVKSYAYYKKHVQDATTRKAKTVSEAKKVIKCCLFFFFVSARSELPLLRTQDILDFQPVAMLKAAQTQGYSLSFLLFLYYVHSFICLQLRHVVAFPSKRKSRADPGVELVVSFIFFIIFFFDKEHFSENLRMRRNPLDPKKQKNWNQ